MRRRNPSNVVVSALKWGGLLVAGYAGHRVLKRVEEARSNHVPLSLAFRYFFAPITNIPRAGITAIPKALIPGTTSGSDGVWLPWTDGNGSVHNVWFPPYSTIDKLESDGSPHFVPVSVEYIPPGARRA